MQARPVRLAAACVLVSAAAWAAGARQPGGPSLAVQFQEALTLMESQGECRKALPLFARVAEGADRALAARALIGIGACEERLGQPNAPDAYRAVIERFPDQRVAVTEARRRLAALAPAAATPPPTPTLRATWPARPRDLVMGGAASRDGRTLAGLDAVGDVVLFYLRTGARVRRVARAGAGTTGMKPVPAPDGRAVAFTWTSPDGPVELRVATHDTTTPRTLLRGRGGEAFMVLDWPRPDRLLLRRTSRDGTVTLAVVDVSTGRPLASLDVAHGTEAAALSPDGRFVALDEPEPGTDRHRVRIVAVEPGTTTETLEGPANRGTVAWTPAGDAVLFLSDRSGTVDLWALPVAAGHAAGPPRLLQRDLGMLIDLVGVTADGALHYNRQIGVVDVYLMALREGAPDGTAGPVTATRVGGNLMPSFTPDGRAITYVTQHPSAAVLEEVSLTDARARPRPVAAAYARRPLWAPDASALLVRGGINDARFGFLAVDPVTGETRPVVTVPENDETSLGPGGWTHDARAVVYAMSDGLVRRHVLATGQSTEWFALPAETRAIAVLPSPRDERVAFVLLGAREARLALRGVDGTWRDLATVPVPGRLLSAAWMPDAAVLVYSATEQGNGMATLMRVPASGGAPESLGVTAEGMRDLAVSPTGRHLAWTAGWPRREPWVLEHVIAPRR